MDGTRNRLPAALWILAAGAFLNRVGSFVPIYFVLNLVGKGHSPASASLVFAGYGAGSMFAPLLGGHLVDWIGCRATICVAMFGTSAVLPLLGLADRLGAIAALGVLAGVAATVSQPATATLIADVVDAPDRTRAFSLYRVAINAGVAAGGVLAGAVVRSSFLYIFFIDAATSAIFGLVVLLVLPAGRVERTDSTATQGDRQRLTRDRRFLRLLAASVLGSLVFFQHQVGLPLRLHDIGLSPGLLAILMTINGVVVLVAQLPVSRMVRRFPPQPLIAAGFALAGFGFALTGLILSILVWTAGEIVMAPAALAYVAELAPPAQRGRYQGAYAFTFSTGPFLASAIGGAVYGWSPAVLWVGCAVAGLVAATLALPSTKDRAVVRTSR
jgi:MFS family permease